MTMEPIETLQKKYAEYVKGILAFYTEATAIQKERIAQELKAINKEEEKLAPKIREEQLVLGVMKRESSAALIRYQAKLQILVERTKALFLETVKDDLQSGSADEQAAKQRNLSWIAFLKGRVRTLADGFECLANEKTTLKEIVKAYNRWQVAGGYRKKMDAKEIQELAEKEFGDSRGQKEYSHLRVFYDEEDVEEFDKENK